MIAQVLSHYRLPLLSCVGLLMFMGVFGGVLAWVFRGGSRGFYESLEGLPLRDDHVSNREVLR